MRGERSSASRTLGLWHTGSQGLRLRNQKKKKPQELLRFSLMKKSNSEVVKTANARLRVLQGNAQTQRWSRGFGSDERIGHVGVGGIRMKDEVLEADLFE